MDNDGIVELNTTNKELDRIDIDYYIDRVCQRNQLPLKVVINGYKVFNITRHNRNKVKVTVDYGLDSYIWPVEFVKDMLRCMFLGDEVVSLKLVPEPSFADRCRLACTTDVACPVTQAEQLQLKRQTNWGRFFYWYSVALSPFLQRSHSDLHGIDLRIKPSDKLIPTNLVTP